MLLLTKIYAQCVHTNDTIMVEKMPKTSPEAQKAAGIDNIPVPSEAFSK